MSVLSLEHKSVFVLVLRKSVGLGLLLGCQNYTNIHLLHMHTYHILLISTLVLDMGGDGRMGTHKGLDITHKSQVSHVLKFWQFLINHSTISYQDMGSSYYVMHQTPRYIFLFIVCIVLYIILQCYKYITIYITFQAIYIYACKIKQLLPWNIIFS